MAVRIVKQRDFHRVRAFLAEHKKECFLLNIFSIPPSLNLAIFDRQGSITDLFVIRKNTLIASCFDLGHLLDAVHYATKLRPSLDTLTCRSAHVPAVRAALVTKDREILVSDTVVHQSLDLKDLIPQFKATDQIGFRPVAPCDAQLLQSWLVAGEAVNTVDPEVVHAYAVRTCARGQDFWALEKDGVPVSIGGLGERCDCLAKVTGVVTDPSQRGQGHARHLVARFLIAAREEQHVETAVLLTRNAAAERCYRNVGFERAAEFSTFHFIEPMLR